jgi:hypothetical protein
MIRLAILSLLVLAACNGPPRLSADIDVSEQTLRPRASFNLGGIGVNLST